MCECVRECVRVHYTFGKNKELAKSMFRESYWIYFTYVGLIRQCRCPESWYAFTILNTRWYAAVYLRKVLSRRSFFIVFILCVHKHECVYAFIPFGLRSFEVLFIHFYMCLYRQICDCCFETEYRDHPIYFICIA